MKWRVTPRAAKELDEIFIHTLQNWGEKQALKYLDEMEYKFDLIAQFPKIGRAIRGSAQNSRRIEQGSHVIVFRETRAGISIQRVTHERMLPLD